MDLSNFFLFRDLDQKTIEHILFNYPPEIIFFKRGEIVFPTIRKSDGVGIVLEGKCEVRRTRCDSNNVVLNVLAPYDSFGILSVFSNDKFPTDIFASTNSKIMFFTKDQIIEIVNNYSQISMNLIQFLANRVSFLNEKIATFSESTVEKKLALYILNEVNKLNAFDFPLNVKKCSEEINVGRASVYRALSSLVDTGFISFNNKKIYINNLDGIERITK